MSKVPTARGDEVDSSQLGFTLMHEHVFNRNPEISANYPETWGDEDEVKRAAVEELQDAHRHGVQTFVDVTPPGLGRDVVAIREIAEQVDLNIVVATGFYTWDALPMFFAMTGPGTDAGGPEKMDELFRRDIEDGIADTGVRAGIIKCTTHVAGVTPGIERVLRACARTHRATGVPITTHTRSAKNGREQQQIFREEGVDLSRVIIGHTDREVINANWEYLEEVVEAGSVLGIDQFGLKWVPDADAKRMDGIAEMCRRGFAAHMVLSHDHLCHCDHCPPSWFAEPSAVPDWNYRNVPTKAVPGLRERGVSEADIEAMTSGNARRIFESTALGPY